MTLPPFVPRMPIRPHQIMMRLSRRAVTIIAQDFHSPNHQRLSLQELSFKLWILLWLAYTTGRTGTCPLQVLQRL